MNKMLVMVVAAALATAAQAYTSYYAFGVVAQHDKEVAGSVRTDYSLYVFTQDKAKALVGTTETVSYTDVADWLTKTIVAEGWTSAISTLVAGSDGEVESFMKTEDNHYMFNHSPGSQPPDAEHGIGVFLYQKDDIASYNVMAQQTGMTTGFSFDDGGKEPSANTGWMTAPEPTSGLLMLLGVAGLALKRKRA